MIVTHAPTQNKYKFSAVFEGKKNLEVRSVTKYKPLYATIA